MLKPINYEASHVKLYVVPIHKNIIMPKKKTKNKLKIINNIFFVCDFPTKYTKYTLIYTMACHGP